MQRRASSHGVDYAELHRRRYYLCIWKVQLPGFDPLHHSSALVLLTARLRRSPQVSWRCLMSLGEGRRCRWAPIKVVKLGAPPADAQASSFAAR